MEQKHLVAFTLGMGVSLGVTTLILLYKVERLWQLCLKLQQSVAELHMLVEETTAISGSRQTGALKQAVSRLTSTTTGEFYDPDSDPTADMWSSCSEKKFYERVDQGVDDHPLSAVQALELRKPEFQNHVGWLWRMAKAHRLLAIKTKDADKRKAELYQAISFAERAIEKKPSSAEAHKWYGVSVGARSEFGTVQDKIRDGFDFKKHIDIAVRLNPRDPVLHHLLGRFCYEVSGLSWIERRAAAALFGSVPTATSEEALERLHKAEELSKKPWLENRYIIAKCYIDQKNYKDAIIWTDKAAKCAVTSVEVCGGPVRLTACTGRVPACTGRVPACMGRVTTDTHWVTTGTHWVTIGTHWVTAGTPWATAGTHWVTTGTYWVTTGTHWLTTDTGRVTACTGRVTTGTGRITTGTHWITIGQGWATVSAS